MSPDERVFREHVTSARFQEGVERGRWQMVGDIAWPVVMIAIAAGPRGRSPSKYVLRFDLTGYPKRLQPQHHGIWTREMRLSLL